jgi:hypothetical protein
MWRVSLHFQQLRGEFCSLLNSITPVATDPLQSPRCSPDNADVTATAFAAAN